MLADHSISIAIISSDCGFNDPSYFSRVFKKELGTHPLNGENSRKIPVICANSSSLELKEILEVAIM